VRVKLLQAVNFAAVALRIVDNAVDLRLKQNLKLVLKGDEVAAVRNLLRELLDLEVCGGAPRLPRILNLSGVARVHKSTHGVLHIVTKLHWAVGDAAPGALECAML
jgi:hypothetical protein